MLKFSPFQTALILGVVLLAGLFALPNVLPADTREDLPGFMPSQTITLGLDLQGGSYLLLEVDTEKVLSDRLRNFVSEVRGALRGRSSDARIRFTQLRVDGDTLSVRISDADRTDEAMRRLRDLSTPLTGPLGPGGRDIEVSRGDGQRVELQLSEAARRIYSNDAVRDSIEVVRRRIDALGTREPSIQQQGEDRIVVQVPGDDDPEALKNVINRTGQLTFHLHDPSVSQADIDAGFVPPGRIILPTDNEFEPEIVVFETPEVTGDMVSSASSGPNTDGAGFQVNFSFDQNGARRFANLTRDNIGRRFAIVLDGRVVSAPVIQTPITQGSGRITGDFTPEEANNLAVLIRSGALPAPLQTLQQNSVGPDLGADSVRAGSIALILGFSLVVVFMVLSYGRFGIYADIALIANVVLLAGALSMLGATLTLPGIAGIVLTIGMAVDANVLIFERIREELLAGKGPVQAVELGYNRAKSAIFDANLTTIFAALIMFLLGSGPVRGFAVTLGIGVMTSVFSAFVLTRLFAGGYVLSKRPKKLAI